MNNPLTSRTENAPSVPRFLRLGLPLLFLVYFAWALTSTSPVQAANVCFCHSTGSTSNPADTICPSEVGQRQGHTTHGDPDFGCKCGNGTCDSLGCTEPDCDPTQEEDQHNCPQDCGVPPSCGDDNIDDGEDCGETGLPACTGEETCFGCRCIPPAPDCFDDTDCNDNDVCNGDEICLNSGTCNPGTPLVCDDGDDCNGTETCDTSLGCQAGQAIVCDDQRACSTESCNSNTGQCEYDVSNCGCDVDIDCDDGNPCTDDSCNVSDGVCLNVADDTNSCDDGNACTESDQCVNGECSGSTVTCNDENSCTDDTCDPASGCMFTNNDLNSCEDGLPCNGVELCRSGQCEAGTAVTCDDSRSCSTDTCNPQTGVCEFDLSACTCSENVDCDDGNPCTQDVCDTDLGTCSNTVNEGAECDDADLCTENDQCQANGSCEGTPIFCEDGDSCTDDVCNRQTGQCESTDNGICGEQVIGGGPAPSEEPEIDSGASPVNPGHFVQGAGCALVKNHSNSGQGLVWGLLGAFLAVPVLRWRRVQ